MLFPNCNISLTYLDFLRGNCYSLSQLSFLYKNDFFEPFDVLGPFEPIWCFNATEMIFTFPNM